MSDSLRLQLCCQSCKARNEFSLQNQASITVICNNCQHQHVFDDNNSKKIALFYDLWHQIVKSQEILPNIEIGIDTHSESLKVPFKLLLTKTSSILSLKVADRSVDIYILETAPLGLENFIRKM